MIEVKLKLCSFTKNTEKNILIANSENIPGIAILKSP